MNAVVSVFESANKHLWVKTIWLRKKTQNNRGFQSWHRDFYLGVNIIATIVVNVGIRDTMVYK